MDFQPLCTGANSAEMRSLQLSSGVIHYTQAGAGPPLVLLHGLSGSGRWWQRNVPNLAQRYRVYTLDMIGFGRSRGQPFTLAGASGVVLDWMDRIGIRRANVIGHSMGGYITIELAAGYPHRVDRVILVDALILPMSPSLIRTAVRLVRALRYLPFDFLPVLISDAFQAGPATLARAGREILQADIRDELDRIQAPVLVVWGEKDTLLPPAVGRLLQSYLANSELCVIPGAGHNPMWDQPEAFNRVVAQFLG